MARRSLERFRRKGLDDLEQRMVAAAASAGLEGARVLEIGGGIGTLQAELLDRGAERGEIVELVSAYEPYARQLAREKGFEERTSFRVADILEHPHTVDPADIVVLNRVVCCSPDGIELTGAAAQLARRTLVLSFPRDVFWVRHAFRAMNAGMWLLRRSYRAFLHPPDALLAAAESDGLRRTEGGRGLVWEFAALTRT
jgi:magnesium-protoporphyrin O-methyltransferase